MTGVFENTHTHTYMERTAVRNGKTRPEKVSLAGLEEAGLVGTSMCLLTVMTLGPQIPRISDHVGQHDDIGCFTARNNSRMAITWNVLTYIHYQVCCVYGNNPVL